MAGNNDMRIGYGLSIKTFAQITSNTDIQTKLETLYQNPDYIDPWIRVLSKDHLPGAAVEELLAEIFKEQFGRLLSGGRFWFENDPTLSFDEKVEIRNTKLSDIILRKTSISSSVLSDDVFHTTN